MFFLWGPLYRILFCFKFPLSFYLRASLKQTGSFQLAKVKPEVSAFGNKIHQWAEPLKTVQHKVEWVEKSVNSLMEIVNEGGFLASPGGS